MTVLTVLHACLIFAGGSGGVEPGLLQSVRLIERVQPAPAPWEPGHGES